MNIQLTNREADLLEKSDYRKAAEGAREAGVHFERRCVVLREAGWRGESDRQCECCERYSMEEPEWQVCEECYLCTECRAEETRDRCEHCQGGADGQ